MRSNAPSLSVVPSELSGPGDVTRRQTSYCELVTDVGATYRIHYKGKEELALSPGRYPGVELRGDHPLLVDYEEARARVYIADAAGEPFVVATEIEQAIMHRFAGWRRPERYENESFCASELLEVGHGLLLRGPVSMCAAATKVLVAHGIRSTTMSGLAPRWPRSVLLLGRSYVIASAFVFERRG